MSPVNLRYLLLIYLRVLVKRRQRLRVQWRGEVQRRIPRYWVQPTLEKRSELGCFNTLFQELRQNDRTFFSLLQNVTGIIRLPRIHGGIEDKKEDHKISYSNFTRGATFSHITIFSFGGMPAITEFFVSYRESNNMQYNKRNMPGNMGCPESHLLKTPNNCRRMEAHCVRV